MTDEVVGVGLLDEDLGADGLGKGDDEDEEHEDEGLLVLERAADDLHQRAHHARAEREEHDDDEGDLEGEEDKDRSPEKTAH